MHSHTHTHTPTHTHILKRLHVHAHTRAYAQVKYFRCYVAYACETLRELLHWAKVALVQ